MVTALVIDDVLRRKIEECQYEESVLRIRRHILEELLSELSGTDDDQDDKAHNDTPLSHLDMIQQHKEKSLSDLRSFLGRDEEEDN